MKKRHSIGYVIQADEKNSNLSPTNKLIFKVSSSFIPITIAYMAGIVWARYALIPTAFSWILIILLATRLLIGLRRPATVFGKYLLIPLFFLLGGVHTLPFLHPPDNPQHIYNQITTRKDVVLVATLLKAPETRGEKSKLLLDARQLKLPTKTISSSGKVLITMAGAPATEIHPGDTVIAKVRLSRPRSFGVPGAFDYTKYLSNQKIWISGWLSSPYLLRKVHTLSPPPFTERILALPERARQKIDSFLTTTLPKETAGIYKAILIGARGGIPTEITENYRAAGNIHLLAISGLHIGLLAFFVCAALVWLIKQSETLLLKWPVWKTATLLSVLPLAIYCLIAGAQTSVLRAIIMTYIFMGAIIWNRQGRILNSLAFAALLLLTINPSDLFAVSFQLSFAAVGSIALILPRISALFQVQQKEIKEPLRPLPWLSHKLGAFCLASILVSFAASLGTAPILAYHFNRIPLLSPISTLLVEPFICIWSLVIGLFASLFIPLPPIATGLFLVGSYGINTANEITAFIAKLSFASLWTTTPTIPMIVSYYGTLSLLLVWCSSKSPRKYFSSKQPIKIGLIVITAASLVISIIDKKDDQDSYGFISVLDVGQGLATVAELPQNRVFVIDGGKHQAGTSKRFNVGRDVIAPFLWKKRISKVTAIILSHPDSDHANGLPFLIEHFRPDTIWTNTSGVKADQLKERREGAIINQPPIKVPKTNEVLYADRNISLKAISRLHTGMEKHEDTPVEALELADNNKSLVIKLTINSHSCIFAGDIEQEAEKDLIRQGVDLKADILIAPHHGSKTSSSDDFIKHVSADYVVISAGINQRKIFPAPERIRKYLESGSTILSTANSGSIFFKIDENIEVGTFY